MTAARLGHVIGPKREATRVLVALADALNTPLAVEDADGRLLHGHPIASNGLRHAITSGGSDVGWVLGPDRARVLAALVEHLLAGEGERRALGTEVLHLYREINLIYSFTEKLAALLDLEAVARLTIQEARHLITASDGAVLLLDEDTDALETIAGFGGSLPRLTGFTRGIGIIGAIAASGVAEIVNDADADPRRITDGTGVHALLCAPMKVGERVIGVIALGNTTRATYTAAELKLLNTLALQSATAIENARLFERTIQAARERERLLAAHKEMEVARARLEREFELAATIQSELFPAAMPAIEGSDLAARNRPARSCGGDYYDALPIAATAGAARVLLCVADVSGKGMPAALLMSHTQATLRALLGRCESLPSLASHASDLLYASTAPNRYVTATFLDLDPTSGRARFVSAGHVDGLVIKADGCVVRLTSTGAPLGLLPPGLPYEETAFTIEPGDCVLLYSDGVVDAQDASGGDFGDEQLLEIVRASADQPSHVVVDRVIEGIDRFAGAVAQFDDITMLVLRRRAASLADGHRARAAS